MAKTSNIQWTDGTQNFWIGCEKVSEGCLNCYAETLDKRYKRDFNVVRRTSDATFYAPLKWKEPQLVFTCSLSDFFHNDADKWREEAWDIMRRTPHLTYQVLTKRAPRMLDWSKTHGWLDNVWAGVTVETQEWVHRLDVLAKVPAKVRFVSCEPLLGPLSIAKYLQCSMCGNKAHFGSQNCPQCQRTWTEQEQRRGYKLDWVIVGGESGYNPRKFDLAWAASIVDQCKDAGVPVFVKQLGTNPITTSNGSVSFIETKDKKGGDIEEFPEALRIRQFPQGYKR